MGRLFLHGRSHLTIAKLKQASARSESSKVSELFLSYFEFDKLNERGKQVVNSLFRLLQNKPRHLTWDQIKLQNCSGPLLADVLTMIIAQCRCDTFIWQNVSMSMIAAEALADSLSNTICTLRRIELKGLVTLSVTTAATLGRAISWSNVQEVVISSHLTVVERESGEAVMADDACRAFSAMLDDDINHNLRSLELVETNLSDKSVASIVASLSKYTGLSKLSLRGNYCHSETRQVFPSLLSSRNFQTLDIGCQSNRSARSGQCCLLVLDIPAAVTCNGHFHLQTLCLSGNALKSADVAVLDRIIANPQFSRLSQLDLCDCHISQDDLPMLSKMVSTAKQLHRLVLDGEQCFSPYGLDGLAIAVSGNCSLQQIDLPSFVPNSECRRIEEYLERNRQAKNSELYKENSVIAQLSTTKPTGGNKPRALSVLGEQPSAANRKGVNNNKNNIWRRSTIQGVASTVKQAPLYTLSSSDSVEMLLDENNQI